MLNRQRDSRSSFTSSLCHLRRKSSFCVGRATKKYVQIYGPRNTFRFLVTVHGITVKRVAS